MNAAVEPIVYQPIPKAVYEYQFIIGIWIEIKSKVELKYFDSLGYIIRRKSFN